MENPVSRDLVLPSAGLEQVAHDGYRSRAAHLLRRLYRPSETEHVVAASNKDFDQLAADVSGSSRNKCGRPAVASHAASVKIHRAVNHRQQPHRTRTRLVQSER